MATISSQSLQFAKGWPLARSQGVATTIYLGHLSSLLGPKKWQLQHTEVIAPVCSVATGILNFQSSGAIFAFLVQVFGSLIPNSFYSRASRLLYLPQ